MRLEAHLSRIETLTETPDGRCPGSRPNVSNLGIACLVWILAMAVCCIPRLQADEASGKSNSPRETLIKITTSKEGTSTLLFVENVQSAEVTVTFEMELVNLCADVSFPYTTTCSPKSRTRAFTLSPIDKTRGWSWKYTYYSTFGSTKVNHDDSCIYWLPYTPGKSYRVSQGYNGEYSHFGADQFAIDWRMPLGTAIYAARGGTVVGVKNDSNIGGDHSKYDWDANYVLIRHPDGTLGQYVHLMKEGTPLKIGQQVRAGDYIGLSGNTGHSTGPHLHFSVFKARDGKRRETIPVRYRTENEVGVTLVEGRAYRAPGSPSSGSLLAGSGARTPEPTLADHVGAQGASAAGH